ncbi:MAG: hypothetical protein KC593_02160 [Myxococcales bacterium]|nr:hypothetical protein [Myxococcales bacterium]MCB9627754.1 hypothetical protein [Sandaracinaceae bacterium]
MSSAPDSAAFHAAVAARRDYLNALFRREGRGVQPEVFMAYLRDVVGPLVGLTAGADSARAEELTTALYRLTLRAHRQGLIGGDAPSAALRHALTRTLPPLLSAFPDRPRDLSLAVCNGALRLERLDTARALAWLTALESLGPSCTDLDTLFSLGLVLAWREGAAEYRPAAHARFAELPPLLRRAALGVETLPNDPARRFAAPMDDAPLGPPAVVARLGGFVGFGGPFRDPPLVVAAEGRLFAFDSHSTTEIFADAFGAALRQVAEPPHDQDAPHSASFSLADDGVLRIGDAETQLAPLAASSSSAWADGVAAVTLPHSHFVFVVGRSGAA